MVRIKAVAKALPEISRTTDEIIPMIETWLQGQDERFQRKVIKIFRNAAVDRRYSLLSPEEVFLTTSFEERNKLYMKGVLKLSETALQNALDKAGWQAKDLDYIISVSCTGIMIPSVDAYLINRLDMRQFSVHIVFVQPDREIPARMNGALDGSPEPAIGFQVIGLIALNPSQSPGI